MIWRPFWGRRLVFVFDLMLLPVLLERSPVIQPLAQLSISQVSIRFHPLEYDDFFTWPVLAIPPCVSMPCPTVPHLMGPKRPQPA